MNNETGTVTGTMTDEERDTILLRIRKLLNLQDKSDMDYVAFSEGKADGRSISLNRQLDKKDKKEITWKKK